MKEICLSNCSGYHGYVLVGYDTMYYGKCVPLFAGNLQPPFYNLKIDSRFHRNFATYLQTYMISYLRRLHSLFGFATISNSSCPNIVKKSELLLFFQEH
jgi:hypothetical protein